MLYMLDTNTVSYLIKGQPPTVRQHLTALPAETRLAVSAVTQGELLYGVARKGNPPALLRVVQEFLMRVEILPWDMQVAPTYSGLRAHCTANGITLSALDMMIAAHAVAAKAVLVTHDHIFARIPDGLLQTEDWAAA
ncbi:type II toxin-antitoxin system VapC family toxin [Cardiobacterium valvarum]|uniref:Ribonuclease VapC n=1 Tax=Cardiobacterium valvarum F0432 TaxID=797473 RepID=G9ZHZ6_9GAMM|nr:type II toxin-antitoxin system VapC family toxin [Cardiobacterium valvarum]EHM52331.1 PIN domain protein [Cardiobacterium valvarum F0432]